MKNLVRINKVAHLEDFKCHISFEDGTQKIIDLEPFLHGPIFKPMREDPRVFRSFHVVEGTIAWDNGADIDPDVLYYNLKPAWMEETITH